MTRLTLLHIASPAMTRTYRAGQGFRDRSDAPAMVVLPAGKALLGAIEETVHEGRTAEFARWEHPPR